jgi:hypothetical protein
MEHGTLTTWFPSPTAAEPWQSSQTALEPWSCFLMNPEMPVNTRPAQDVARLCALYPARSHGGYRYNRLLIRGNAVRILPRMVH